MRRRRHFAASGSFDTCQMYPNVSKCEALILPCLYMCVLVHVWRSSMANRWTNLKAKHSYISVKMREIHCAAVPDSVALPPSAHSGRSLFLCYLVWIPFSGDGLVESEHSARTRMEWRGQFKTPFRDECSNSLTHFEKSHNCCIPFAFRAGKHGFCMILFVISRIEISLFAHVCSSRSMMVLKVLVLTHTHTHMHTHNAALWPREREMMRPRESTRDLFNVALWKGLGHHVTHRNSCQDKPSAQSIE